MDEGNSEFCNLKTQISAMNTSQEPDNKYVAVGTVIGQIIIYKTKNIMQGKPYQRFKFTFHNDSVTELEFIPVRFDYQLASYG